MCLPYIVCKWCLLKGLYGAFPILVLDLPIPTSNDRFLSDLSNINVAGYEAISLTTFSFS